LIHPDNPFHPDNHAAYQAWREAKLRDYPKNADALLVRVNNPKSLSADEHTALLTRLRKANMAIYAGPDLGADKDVPRLLGGQFGLKRLDANLMSDEDAITTLTVAEDGEKKGEFIPYTDRPIRWHTDGYYNQPDRWILGMMLHSVAPAAEGGENALLDHEMLYLLLRDENPDTIRALMQPDTMSIPARMDEHGVARAEETGPVFATLPGGQLIMRYTARTRSINWKQDAATQAAVSAIEKLLAQDLPYMFRHKLEAGMGLICNNILHDRTGFVDTPTHKRIMFRSRYYDRVSNT
jgi:hypothetical protein